MITFVYLSGYYKEKVPSKEVPSEITSIIYSPLSSPFKSIEKFVGLRSVFEQTVFPVVSFILKSASNLNGNLNCSKELEHYAS
jgi:hypothetical protein